MAGWVLVVVALTVFSAGLLRGFAGFGSSLLMMPVLSTTIGPARALVISTLMEGLASLMLVPSSLPDTDKVRLARMAIAAAIAIPLGHWILVKVDPGLSNVLISGAIVVMSALVWRGGSLRLPRGRNGEVGAGLVSGFFTGFGSIGGPPLVLYVLSAGGSSAQKRADVIVAAGCAQGVAVLSMFAFGLLTIQGAGDAALAAPVFFVGGMLGAKLFRRASEQAYQRIAVGALMATASGLLLLNLWRLVS